MKHIPKSTVSTGQDATAAHLDLWRYILDALEEPSFLHDENFCVILANKAYFTVSGKTDADILGKPYWETFPAGSIPLPGVNQNNTNSSIDNSCNGSEVSIAGRTYHSTGFKVHDDHGNFQYALHLFQNIQLPSWTRTGSTMPELYSSQ